MNSLSPASPSSPALLAPPAFAGELPHGSPRFSGRLHEDAPGAAGPAGAAGWLPDSPQNDPSLALLGKALQRADAPLDDPGAWAFPCAVSLAVPCLQAVAGGLPLQYLLKDVYGMSPAALGLVSAPCALIWAASPFWGFLTDALPLLGCRRQSYAVLSAATTSAGLLALGRLARTPLQVAAALLVANLGMAFLVVTAQALVVETARSGSLTSATGRTAAFLGMRQLGLLAGTLISGNAVHRGVHPHSVFAHATIAPVLLLFLALSLSERRHAGSALDLADLCARGLNVPRALLGQPGLRDPAVFIACCAMTPKAVHAMFFFYTDIAFFSPKTVMGITMTPHVLSLAGIALYCTLAESCELRTFLSGMSITVALVTLLPLLPLLRINLLWGIGEVWFVPFDDGLAVASLEVMLLPLLTLCARSCPQRLEGTMCAVLMASYHLGLFCSAHLSGFVTSSLLGIASGELSLLWVAKLLTSLFQLTPLLLLGLVPERADQGPTSLQEAAEEQQPR